MIRLAARKRLWRVQSRSFFKSSKTTKEEASRSDSRLVLDDSRSHVRISVEEEPTEISTEVKMGGSGGGAQSTVNDTIHVPRSKESKGDTSLAITLTTLGIATGYLWRRYYQRNDAEAFLLNKAHPSICSALSHVGMFKTDTEKRYAKYDYMLYAARFAAAVLLNTDHSVRTMEDFVKLLQDWIDVSSLQIDLTAPLNHSSIMSVLTQIKSLPTYYAIYLLGEREFNISPVTAAIQAEINAFYDYAKEDEEGKRGVHSIYVLSILKNIQNHTGTTLKTHANEYCPFFSFSNAKKEVDADESLVRYVRSLENPYVSLIQLTNILACANRQIASDTLLIYRLRLAAKKVADDRAYQESLLKKPEPEIVPLLRIPLISIKGEAPSLEKSTEEVLEEEIVKAAPVVDIKRDIRVVEDVPKETDKW